MKIRIDIDILDLMARTLPAEEIASALGGLKAYLREGVVVDNNRAFDALRESVDSALRVSVSNKENIQKRWMNRNTNVYERIRTNTNVYERIEETGEEVNAENAKSNTDKEIADWEDLANEQAKTIQIEEMNSEEKPKEKNQKKSSVYSDTSVLTSVCIELPEVSNERSSMQCISDTEEVNLDNKIAEKDLQAEQLQVYFDLFWKHYPRRQAKQDAIKAFVKLNPSEELLNRMIEAIEVRKRTKDWQKESGQFIPLPATWIRGRRWEDEVKAPIQPTTDIDVEVGF